MSRHVDITTINPRTYESSEVELGVLAYDYDEIEAMPFLDIVRCEECRHWRSGVCLGIPFNGDDASYIETEADDFCSYGERESE